MGKIDHKNEDFSKSVNSFHSRPIYSDALGQDLSRNVGLMSIYAVQKKLPIRKSPGMMPKMAEISGKVASATSRSNFGGPAGGSALERASPFTMQRIT